MVHVPVPRYLYQQLTSVGLPSANTSSLWAMAITRYRLLVSTLTRFHVTHTQSQVDGVAPR